MLVYGRTHFFELTRILAYVTVSSISTGSGCMSEQHFLQIKDLSKYFEGVSALEKIDLCIQKGEVVSLIGPNGAGKTTFFNCITGMITPTSGSIHFLEEQISQLKPFEITCRGVSRTFQNIRIFSEMTVLENVLVGRYRQSALPITATFFGALFRARGFKEQEAKTRVAAMQLLEFVGLTDQAERTARHLAYGDQRRLEIARAMASNPLLLLLDEPAAGMNPQETHKLMALIGKIRDLGITPFLIEHNMQMVMGISDQIIVLDHGEKIAKGTPDEIQQNKQVIAAYLGGE